MRAQVLAGDQLFCAARPCSRSPAPAVSVELSSIRAAGDKLLTAAMLCTWSYGFGCVDAATALADLGTAPRRSYLGVMDELWRALRGAPGLVEHADSLTRLNRARGMASIMITHSLADLDALTTEEDRARARGFTDRSAITVQLTLVGPEVALHDTDQAIRASRAHTDQIEGLS